MISETIIVSNVVAQANVNSPDKTVNLAFSGDAVTLPGALSVPSLSATSGVSGANLSATSGMSSPADTVQATNGAYWIRGYNTELLVLSTTGLTTDTTNNLLPANSVIEAVVARITTALTVTTDWKLGDGTTAGRFSAADSTLTLGETVVGLAHWSGAVSTLAAGPSQATAAHVRVTCTGSNPGAGAIRITVFYSQFVGPTS